MSDAATGSGETDLFGHRPRTSSPVRQLPLPLGWSATIPAGAGGMIVGSSNRVAVEHVLNHRRWSAPASILIGPPASGRTMLGRLFFEGGGFIVVDDWDGGNEETLFHDWNRAQAAGEHMLIIAASHDALTRIRLPDLATRLATAPVVTLEQPDACLARDLLERLLTQRGVSVPPQLGSYVAARVERSYAAIHAAAAAIDAHALAAGGGVGIRGARAALIAARLYVDPGDAADVMEPS